MNRKHPKLANSTSVITNIKKFKKVSNSSKMGHKPKDQPMKGTPMTRDKSQRRRSSCDDSSINGKIHFHQDVPEEVQNFIKRISSEPPTNPLPQPDPNLLDIKDDRLSRRMSLPVSGSDEELYPVSRKASIPVIVTADYAPNNLSNNDYDKLKSDTRFTEYEIVQLWTTFKKEFPNGRINRQQLHDLIKIIFPRGVPDLFIENIFRIFDPQYNGFIRFTDLLIAFSMSMKGSGTRYLFVNFSPS